jgi:Na+/melibiose symporter-like transporter
MTIPLVRESRATGNTRYDVPGAATATAGLVSLVYGFTKAASDGWSSAATLGFVGAGVVLLVAFVVVELRSANPLLPLRIVLDRNRGGAFLASTLTGAGLFGAFLFITFYFQAVLHYTPLKAGLASLPVTAGVLIAAAVASQLVPKLGPKVPMVIGGVTAAAGMLYLTQIGVSTSFATHVLPAELILGLGLGFTFVPLSSLALVGVPEKDAGAASATLNATQQIGGSLGTALLNTIYTTAVTGYLTSHVPTATGPAPTPQAQMQIQLEGFVHGYTVAFAWGAAILVLSAVVIVTFIKVRKDDLPSHGGAVHVG